MTEDAWGSDTAFEPHVFQSGAIRVFPESASISGAIDTSHLLCNPMPWKSQLLRKAHEDVPFGQSVEVGLPNIDKRNPLLFASPDWLVGILGKQDLLRLKRWRGRVKGSLCGCAIVDLARDQSRTNVRVGSVTLVAEHPSASHQFVVLVPLHRLYVGDLPNFRVEIIQLINDRCLDEVCWKYLIGVLVAVQWLEIPVVEGDGNLAAAYLLALRLDSNTCIALDNCVYTIDLWQEALGVLGRPDSLDDCADQSRGIECGCCASATHQWLVLVVLLAPLLEQLGHLH